MLSKKKTFYRRKIAIKKTSLKAVLNRNSTFDRIDGHDSYEFV